MVRIILFIISFVVILISIRCHGKMFQKVLVVGGTGRVGSRIVANLLSRGVETTVMVRDVDAARAQNYLSGATIYVGNVNSMDDLLFASEGCDAIVSVQGVKPPRFSKLKDLFVHPKNDAGHPYNINYMGTKRILAAMHINRINRLVRITGSLVGKSPFFPFVAFFNILLSKTVKWHEMSEIAIRQANVDYTIIRPSEISSDAPNYLYNRSAENDGRHTFMTSADNGSPYKTKNAISVEDVAELCTQSLFDDRLDKATVICGTTIEQAKERQNVMPAANWDEFVQRSDVSSELSLKGSRH